LLDHGAIDMIIDRRKMRDVIGDLLAKFEGRPSPVSAT
jgi:acetyl-CoA carboxylase carboxyl transferase subunit beta